MDLDTLRPLRAKIDALWKRRDQLKAAVPEPGLAAQWQAHDTQLAADLEREIADLARTLAGADSRNVVAAVAAAEHTGEDLMTNRKGIPYAEWKEQLANAVAAQMPGAERALAAESQQLVPMASTAPPLVAATLAEQAELRRQLAEVNAQRLVGEAKSFVAEQLRTGRAYPAESSAMLALYVQFAQDDLVASRDAGQLSGIALLQAAYNARPPHYLDQNMVAGTPSTGRVLANSSAADPYADDVASATTYAERANGSRAK
jgi:hypothetical protein